MICSVCETKLPDKFVPCYECEAAKKEALELYEKGQTPADIFFQTGICLLIEDYGGKSHEEG